MSTGNKAIEQVEAPGILPALDAAGDSFAQEIQEAWASPLGRTAFDMRHNNKPEVIEKDASGSEWLVFSAIPDLEKNALKQYPATVSEASKDKALDNVLAAV